MPVQEPQRHGRRKGTPPDLRDEGSAATAITGVSFAALTKSAATS